MSKCRYDLSEDCNNTDCLNCVFDKIKAEIKQEIIPRNSDRYDHEVMWQNMGLRMALKVIDKYKAEVEPNGGEE